MGTTKGTVLLAVLTVGISVQKVQGQQTSALEFYDSTGATATSRFGWNGNAANGHFFIETPADGQGVKVEQGVITADGFAGDGSGLTGIATGNIAGLSADLERKADTNHTHQAGDITDSIPWSRISSRPAGLDDGDDVGTTGTTDLSAYATKAEVSDSVAYAPREPGTTSGQVWKWNASTGTGEWGNDATEGTATSVNWEDISGRPYGLDDGDDSAATVDLSSYVTRAELADSANNKVPLGHAPTSAGTEGQVWKTVGGTAQWAADETGSVDLSGYATKSDVSDSISHAPTSAGSDGQVWKNVGGTPQWADDATGSTDLSSYTTRTELGDTAAAIRTTVSQNATDIAANSSSISTNSSNISSNQSSISSNTSNISANASDISANTTNISSNTSDITDNATSIDGNTAGINSNSNDIAANTNALGDKADLSGATFSGPVNFTDGANVDTLAAKRVSLDGSSKIMWGEQVYLYGTFGTTTSMYLGGVLNFYMGNADLRDVESIHCLNTIASNVIQAPKVMCNSTDLCSDRRYKQAVVPIIGALAKVSALEGVRYSWRTSEFPDRHFQEGRQIGLIAQDVEKVVPEVVNTHEDGYKGVDYSKLTAVLIEATKEQQSIIDEQDARIAKQQEQIDALLERVTALEKSVNNNEGLSMR